MGPNGSGKSNVIDALLFVFGKRAKQLRQGKVGDLLHFSENHQNIQSAKVSVYFHEIIDKVCQIGLSFWKIGRLQACN